MTTEARVTRTLMLSRSSPSGPVCLDVVFVATTDRSRVEVEFLPIEHPRSDEFRLAVTGPAWEKWYAMLAPPRLGSLHLEAGLVSTTVEVDGSPPRHSHRLYFLVREGAFLRHLGSFREPAVLPETIGTRPVDAASDLPVVLGPSATLALATWLVNDGWGGDPETDWGDLRWLSFIDAAHSPHPVSDLSPLTGVGFGGDRDVVVDGRRVEPPGPVADVNPFLNQICAHTESWLRPMGALDDDCQLNPRIACSLQAVEPGASLVIAAVEPPCCEARESTSLRAKLCVARGFDGATARVTEATIEINPRELLGSVVGALSPPRPAVLFDPIAGGRYGLAPSLLTWYRAGDLRWS